MESNGQRSTHIALHLLGLDVIRVDLLQALDIVLKNLTTRIRRELTEYLALLVLFALGTTFQKLSKSRWRVNKDTSR